MKLLSLIFCGIAFISFASAVPAIGSLGQICNYYSGVTGYNNSLLISTVVGDVVQTAVSANSPIKKYFDGTFPVGSRNFLAANESAALANLFSKLVSFFGAVLNCSDGSIGPYTGRSMIAAHANMNTDFYAFSVFNNAVVASLLKYGVNQTDANLVASALNGQRGACSNATTCQTICNRYTVPAITSNQALVGAVVDGTINAALVPANGLLQFFNGTTPAGSTDFTNNPTQFTRLRTNLITYFGGALGCSDGTIGAYAGRSMKAAHANIPIGNASFVTFNGAVISVMRGAGVSEADLVTVAAVLEGERGTACTLSDCGNPIPTTGVATMMSMDSQPSSAYAFAPVFFLFALLLAFF